MGGGTRASSGDKEVRGSLLNEEDLASKIIDSAGGDVFETETLVCSGSGWRRELPVVVSLPCDGLKGFPSGGATLSIPLTEGCP